MSVRDFGLLYGVCLVWALNNIISKIVVTDLGVPPLFYAAVRFALVALLVFPWLRPMPRPRWRLICVALLMGAGNFALLFIGLQDATPSAAAVVGQLGVPLTTLFAMLILGERIGWRRALGIALTFVGAVAVIYEPGAFSPSVGLIYVAGSAALGSLGAVMMKQMDGVKPLQFQAWVGLTSALPLAVLSGLLEPGQVAAGLDAGWPFIMAVAFSAIIVSIGAHTLYYGLILRYEANLLAALTLLMPLNTIALGIVITGDRFDAQTAIGTVAALIGVLIIAGRRNRTMPEVQVARNRAQ